MPVAPKPGPDNSRGILSMSARLQSADGPDNHRESYYFDSNVARRLRRRRGEITMEVIVTKTYQEMSRSAAQAVAEVLNAKPNAVLGMATGSTPLGVYQELVRMHQRGELDFSQVTTFNLDEYVGLPTNHPQSYHFFMHENFFRKINIPPQNVHIP